MSYYDDEDNIGRDVEEQEKKRVVINNAAALCNIFFPNSHHVELFPAAM